MTFLHGPGPVCVQHETFIFPLHNFFDFDFAQTSLG